MSYAAYVHVCEEVSVIVSTGTFGMCTHESCTVSNFPSVLGMCAFSMPSTEEFQAARLFSPISLSCEIEVVLVS